MFITKKGFWCFVQFHKFHWQMMWETYDSWNGGEGDYGYVDYWTGNCKTFEELKWYDHYGWGYDEYGFTFVVPFFIAYILVLKGTIKERISTWLYFRRARKEAKEFAEKFSKESENA